MTKTNTKTGLEKRDWAIIVLLAAVVSVGWYAYQINQARMLSENTDSQSWLNQQVQINKLKVCIDQGTKPCEINPRSEQ